MSASSAHAAPRQRRPSARATAREVSGEGVIINLSDVGEADVLVTLFTRSEGVLRGMAPSAKKSARRFGGRLDLLNRVHVTYRRKRGPGGSALVTLTETRLIASSALLARDVSALGQAEAFGELLGSLAPEGEPHRDLYALFLYFLDRLIGETAGRRASPPALIGLYGFRALGLLGYRPVLDHCVATGVRVDEAVGADWLLSPRRGGLVVRAALDPAEAPRARAEAPALSLATIKTLDTALTLPTPLLARLAPTATVGRESVHALRLFVRCLLGRELKALMFLQRTRA